VAQQRHSLGIAAEGPEVLVQPMDPRHQIHQSVIALRAPLRSRLQEACRFNRGGIRKASDPRADGLDSGVPSNANLKDEEEEEDEHESR